MCGHKNLRHLHTRETLRASEEKADQVKAQKVAAIQNSDLPLAEKRKKKVRKQKVLVQELYCICFLRNGDCPCSVGPFKYSEMEQIAGWKQDYDNSLSEEDFGAQTTSQNAGALVASVLDATLAVSTGYSIL